MKNFNIIIFLWNNKDAKLRNQTENGTFNKNIAAKREGNRNKRGRMTEEYSCKKKGSQDN